MPDKEMTILIVEDEMLIRMHGADVLGEAGYLVLEAADADEALTILLENRPVDLMFSDIDMPGSMDGLSLAQHVHKRWPDIRLLLTSGHHRLSDDEIPDAGRFMHKPWTEDRLLTQVQELTCP